MIKKGDKRAEILKHAFEVFMEKGYENASITSLQEHMKISRGVIYSYFDSKDALFEAVMEKYMLRVLDIFFPKFENKDVTVSERIELLREHMRSVEQFLSEIDGMDVKILNYSVLFIQASKKYPDLLERIKKYKNEDFKAWKLAVKRSVEKGEIRPDVDLDITASLFARISGVFEGFDDLGKNFRQRTGNDLMLMKQILSLNK